MRKGIIAATMIAVFVSLTSMAFAEVGFQFRIPVQVTGKKSMKDFGGTSVLLTFDLDSNTQVGILNDNITFTDNGDPTAPVKGLDYQLTAIRFAKSITEPISVGVDFGQVSTAAASTNVADLFGNVKLLTSKGKVTSFLSVELLYRFLKNDLGTAGINDFSGAMINIGAGINF